MSFLSLISTSVSSKLLVHLLLYLSPYIIIYSTFHCSCSLFLSCLYLFFYTRGRTTTKKKKKMERTNTHPPTPLRKEAVPSQFSRCYNQWPCHATLVLHVTLTWVCACPFFFIVKCRCSIGRGEKKRILRSSQCIFVFFSWPFLLRRRKKNQFPAIVCVYTEMQLLSILSFYTQPRQVVSKL